MAVLSRIACFQMSTRGELVGNLGGFASLMALKATNFCMD
jgi:hypothetical protein